MERAPRPPGLDGYGRPIRLPSRSRREQSGPARSRGLQPASTGALPTDGSPDGAYEERRASIRPSLAVGGERAGLPGPRPFQPPSRQRRTGTDTPWSPGLRQTRPRPPGLQRPSAGEPLAERGTRPVGEVHHGPVRPSLLVENGRGGRRPSSRFHTGGGGLPRRARPPRSGCQSRLRQRRAGKAPHLPQAPRERSLPSPRRATTAR